VQLQLSLEGRGCVLIKKINTRDLQARSQLVWTFWVAVAVGVSALYQLHTSRGLAVIAKSRSPISHTFRDDLNQSQTGSIDNSAALDEIALGDTEISKSGRTPASVQ
jgi:hypothetical protein